MKDHHCSECGELVTCLACVEVAAGELPRGPAFDPYHRHETDVLTCPPDYAPVLETIGASEPMDFALTATVASQTRRALNGWRKPSRIAFEPERACSDCLEYAPVSTMPTTPAGNVICPSCVKRRARLAADRAQLSLLDQQSLF